MFIKCSYALKVPNPPCRTVFMPTLMNLLNPMINYLVIMKSLPFVSSR